MKLVKMSLAAALLLSASAFALDNVKVSGDAKLFYGTSDAGSDSLFAKDNSYADTALRVGVTGDLLKGVSFGVTGYAISTLGLENNLVSGVWTSAHGVTGNGSDFLTGAQVDDTMWIGEAWMATTLGKTTAKIGRMELDTPLAFSEKWNIVPNTFEAAVLINQDLPDTTLVGAWVGKGNGQVAVQGVGSNAKFNTFAENGAYAAGLVNNSFKPLTFQAWYYNVADVATAYWLQADVNCQLIPGVKLGAQYAEINPDAAGAKDSEAYALKVGYATDKLNLAIAYSDVDKDGVVPMQNVASGSQSKLYTEAWWNYGYVGAPDAETVTLTGEYDAGMAKLGAYYTDVDGGDNATDMTEFTVTASKSFGPLDATLAYVSTEADNQNGGDQYNTLQAYLTLNF